jgi:hypothetical protein
MSLSPPKCKIHLSPGHVSCKKPKQVTFAPEGEMSSSLHSYTEVPFLISHFSLDTVLVSCLVLIISSTFHGIISPVYPFTDYKCKLLKALEEDEEIWVTETL